MPSVRAAEQTNRPGDNNRLVVRLFLWQADSQEKHQSNANLVASTSPIRCLIPLNGSVISAWNSLPNYTNSTGAAILGEQG